MTAPEGSARAAALDGTGWVLSAWAEPTDPTPFAITAAFADGKVTGSSGVNRYGGGIDARADGELAVGVLWSTMMAGPEPAMRAETAYHRLLESAVRFRTARDRLVLLDSGGAELLIFVADG